MALAVCRHRETLVGGRLKAHPDYGWLSWSNFGAPPCQVPPVVPHLALEALRPHLCPAVDDRPAHLCCLGGPLLHSRELQSPVAYLGECPQTVGEGVVCVCVRERHGVFGVCTFELYWAGDRMCHILVSKWFPFCHFGPSPRPPIQCTCLSYQVRPTSSVLSTSSEYAPCRSCEPPPSCPQPFCTSP